MSTSNGHNGTGARALGGNTLELLGSMLETPANTSISGVVAQRHEHRLRVTCFLPLNSEQQALAVEQFIHYLHLQAEGDDFQIEGFTMTDPLSLPWIGYWYSSDDKQWIEDRIVLCMIDLRLNGVGILAARCMLTLKQVIAHLYHKYAGDEKDIWITAQHVFRHS